MADTSNQIYIVRKSYFVDDDGIDRSCAIHTRIVNCQLRLRYANHGVPLGLDEPSKTLTGCSMSYRGICDVKIGRRWPSKVS
jgi:hypothetical protein